MFSKSTVHKSSRFTAQYWRRLIGFLVIALSIAFTGLLIFFVNRQVNAFITPHRIRNIGSPNVVSDNSVDVNLTTADKLNIAGWYFPGHRPQGMVLVHGINANRAAVMPEARILAEAGFHLLLIDLRGHGLSDASMATYGYNEALDVKAAVDYLLALPDVEQVGVLGTSYGGAAVVRAAATDERIKAVVVESSFASMADAVEDAFDDMSIFPKWPFASIMTKLGEQQVGLEISQVDSARDLVTLSPRSVLIIHGSNDHLFPLYHAQKMYEAAREPKALWVIEGMGHQNPVKGREEEFRQRVVTFLETAFAAQ